MQLTLVSPPRRCHYSSGDKPYSRSSLPLQLLWRFAIVSYTYRICCCAASSLRQSPRSANHHPTCALHTPLRSASPLTAHFGVSYLPLVVTQAMALVCAMGARQLQEPELHVVAANNPTPTALLSVSSFSRKLLEPEEPKEPAVNC